MKIRTLKNNILGIERKLRRYIFTNLYKIFVGNLEDRLSIPYDTEIYLVGAKCKNRGIKEIKIPLNHHLRFVSGHRFSENDGRWINGQEKYLFNTKNWK